MYIEAFQSSFNRERVIVIGRDQNGTEVCGELSVDQAQQFAENVLIAAAAARRFEAERNQPDLFAVAELTANSR